MKVIFMAPDFTTATLLRGSLFSRREESSSFVLPFRVDFFSFFAIKELCNSTTHISRKVKPNIDLGIGNIFPLHPLQYTTQLKLNAHFTNILIECTLFG